MKKTLLILALATAIAGCSKTTPEVLGISEEDTRPAIESAVLVADDGSVIATLTKHCDGRRLIIVTRSGQSGGSSVIDDAPECQ